MDVIIKSECVGRNPLGLVQALGLGMRSTLGSGRFGLGDSEIEDSTATFAGDDLLIRLDFIERLGAKAHVAARTESVLRFDDGRPGASFSDAMIGAENT